MSPHVFGQDTISEIHTDYAHERIDELERRTFATAVALGLLAVAVAAHWLWGR